EPQRLLATLAADAALLHAAERGAQVAEQPAIDPDGATLEAFGDTVGPVEVTSPQTCGKAILNTVGVVEQFVLAAEWRDRDDRAENLLLVDTAAYGQIDRNSRLDEGTAGASTRNARRTAAAQNLAAFFTNEAQV